MNPVRLRMIEADARAADRKRDEYLLALGRRATIAAALLESGEQRREIESEACNIDSKLMALTRDEFGL